MLDVNSEYGLLAALVLGFLLGLKHATDADHVVAVASIVNESKNVWRGLWIGASWGVGHTVPLVILGIIVLLLKEAVLDRYETIAPIFEIYWKNILRLAESARIGRNIPVTNWMKRFRILVPM